jgi:hypothetical protein
MRSRCCSGPGRPTGDTKVSGRRVTCKAPSLAHVEGGSSRSEASPTATLQDTHSVEGQFPGFFGRLAGVTRPVVEVETSVGTGKLKPGYSTRGRGLNLPAIRAGQRQGCGQLANRRQVRLGVDLLEPVDGVLADAGELGKVPLAAEPFAPGVAATSPRPVHSRDRTTRSSPDTR